MKESSQEKLLCSLNLPGRTTSSEIFEALNSYFIEHGIEWKKCIGICTDGAANMVGHISGIVAKVKMLVTQTFCQHTAFCIVNNLRQKNFPRTTQSIIRCY